jgi:hypothetical protein
VTVIGPGPSGRLDRCVAFGHIRLYHGIYVNRPDLFGLKTMQLHDTASVS